MNTEYNPQIFPVPLCLLALIAAVKILLEIQKLLYMGLTWIEIVCALLFVQVAWGKQETSGADPGYLFREGQNERWAQKEDRNRKAALCHHYKG